MNLDYDLVIIGGTPAAIAAAVTAVRYKGRIGLVIPETPRQHFYPGLFPDSLLGGDRGNLSDRLDWSALVSEAIVATPSLEILATLGVDIIFGNGQFLPRPKLAFEVGRRRLISRTYLLAVASKSYIPPIPGLVKTEYLSAATIARLRESPLPKKIAIVGGDREGLEIAQVLCKIGIEIALLTPEPALLAEEDPEAAQLIEAELEAAGIQVLTDTHIREITQSREGIVLQAEGDRAIAADLLLLTCGVEPDFDGLNLDRVGVEFADRELLVNRKFQTSNPRVYAINSSYRGYREAHRAEVEAKIAVKNALFLPIFKIGDRPIPRVLFTQPQLATVGLTQPQARAQYGNDLEILRDYYKDIPGGKLRDEPTGLCKILVTRNGRIVGAHLVGSQASELIHPFVLAMQKGLKVEAIASLPYIWPSLSRIEGQTAQQWKQKRRDRQSLWQTLLETWFNWRR
ncbi:NAD(P)/FAD-dependent oxidoreductase [Oxynema sp. CENA135]|uniref:FAD-dependent oxidoreductase n=1 Tax=Oxynema sp. CENA135 TaxID=984206 RepID=UPI00190C10F5|nr:NAD(P)/FAD-dependent oxidoreductase [Oxynema sp. CENA135]